MRVWMILLLILISLREVSPYLAAFPWQVCGRSVLGGRMMHCTMSPRHTGRHMTAPGELGRRGVDFAAAAARPEAGGWAFEANEGDDELGDSEDAQDSADPDPSYGVSRTPLRVLFQDEYLAVVSKPGGMLMHRSRDARRDSVFFLQTVRDQLGKQVFFANRLDRGTSGMVVMAFDGSTAAKLQGALAADEASKEYLCLVRGTPSAACFESRRPLTDKDSADKKKREAHTSFCTVASWAVPLREEFRPLLPRTVGADDPRVSFCLVNGGDTATQAASSSTAPSQQAGNWACAACHSINYAVNSACFKCGASRANSQSVQAGGGGQEAREVKMFVRDVAVSLLVARIFTGRRHQIRRHLQHAALNILGDTSYGKGRINQGMREQYALPRMMLHAWRLRMRHPVTDALLRLEDPMPEDMTAFLSALAQQQLAPSSEAVAQLLAALPCPIAPVTAPSPRTIKPPHFDAPRHAA